MSTKAKTLSENHSSFIQSYCTSEIASNYAKMKLVKQLKGKTTKQNKKLDTTLSWKSTMQLQNRSFQVVDWRKKVYKMYKRLTKNVRAKPAKRRLVFVKYVNLWSSCSSRRHDYLSSSLQFFPYGSSLRFESSFLLITKKKTFSQIEANL